MSKQRPSSVSARPAALTRKPRAVRAPAGYWRKRVFKNTYTRAGHCIQLRGWSVKIQHQGTRRTFSLEAKSRAAAAIEAQAIYQTLVTQGWDAVAPGPRHAGNVPGAGGDGKEQSWPRTDLHYWKRRLLRRRHASPTIPSASRELSVRIDHAGTGHHFPLGTINEDDAAARAREIYVAVVRDGWNTVRQRYACELTVAVHWTDNPLAWTYATLHTVTRDEARSVEPRQSADKARTPVVVIEPDASIRRALAVCVNHHDGFACVAAHESATSAVAAMAGRPPRLVLANHILPHLAADALVDRLSRIVPVPFVLFYSTYEDSDQLFKATPGGAEGYLLKRTPAEGILEPIAQVPGNRVLSPEQIFRSVREYFQDVIRSLPAVDAGREMVKLTHREHEILNLLSKGYVDKEIAGSLGISVWTVHGHLKRVFEKLGVHTRTEAVVKYLYK